MPVDSRERKEGRERETLVSCLLMHLEWGLNLQPRYVPQPGIKPANFWCTGQCSNQLSHPVMAEMSLRLFCCSSTS